MKILVCNDDGVYAAGIKSLHHHLCRDYKATVVAPLEERSTTGHTLSLDNPLRLVKIEENIFGCSGYPADCSLMGFSHVMKGEVDLVVSGINRGANLGQDIYYSGTVAAAREASFHNIPAIAVSTSLNFNEPIESKNIYYDTAAKFTRSIIADGVVELISKNQVVNINVPNLPEDQIKGVKLCSLGFRRYSEEITQRKDFRDRDYFWIGGAYQGFIGGDNSDVYAVEHGYISVSLLNLLGQKTDTDKDWIKFLSNY